MLKKILSAFFILFASFQLQATDFKEGDHYKVLDLPESKSPLITEFFSFYCPHCFRMEPIVQALKTQLPEDVKFQKEHVSFMGGAQGKNMSKAFATAILLEKQSEIVPALFRQLHVKKTPPKNVEDIKNVFVESGINAEQFDGAFNSFAAHSMVSRFDKSFKDSGLTGVPALIVNNKYLVKTGKITSNEQYFELVNYLLTK
jgi:thiol:disulfide interchange protein DsbA